MMQMMSVPMKGQNKIKRVGCISLYLISTDPIVLSCPLQWPTNIPRKRMKFVVKTGTSLLAIWCHILKRKLSNCFPHSIFLLLLIVSKMPQSYFFRQNLLKLVGILLGTLWCMPLCSFTYSPNFFFYKIKIWTQYVYVLQ